MSRMKALFPSLLDDEAALEQAAQAVLAADESRDRAIRRRAPARSDQAALAPRSRPAGRRTEQRRDAQEAAPQSAPHRATLVRKPKPGPRRHGGRREAGRD